MSRPLVISSADTEYVPARVTPGKQNGTRPNPTTVPVYMAFMQNDVEPGVSDWKAATWDTDSSGAEPIYEARCLVGPSSTVTLSNGEYRVWVKVADSPEVAIKRIGRLVIT